MTNETEKEEGKGFYKQASTALTNRSDMKINFFFRVTGTTIL